jgi:hypothetical protein
MTPSGLSVLAGATRACVPCAGTTLPAAIFHTAAAAGAQQGARTALLMTLSQQLMCTLPTTGSRETFFVGSEAIGVVEPGSNKLCGPSTRCVCVCVCVCSSRCGSLLQLGCIQVQRLGPVCPGSSVSQVCEAGSC